ncbi:transmembrane protein 187 [Limanda limanda]|uniref:transmembrane protein 187 n=1 Tax=Limanda limanda TaxID=27771 RepID=UPI0029C83E15|nr:transmembrane protein 187 [Limanda limanda]
MRWALLHVSLPFLFCVMVANTSLFDGAAVDLSYDHYAERRVEYLPLFLAMPCNCAVNVLYILMGVFWLRSRAGEGEQSRYLRRVFALMAILYAPVQWTRLALLRRAPAVLDQWFTLPIFAWVPVWISFIERGPAKWRASHAAAAEACSLLSYGLALVHERGFDVALCCHVAVAVFRGVRVQRTHGNGRTRAYLLLAMLSCAGFVLLKLLDHWLARYRLLQRFTGHFWSKVCDVLQFHFSFCFLSTLTHRAREKSAARRR